MDESGGFVGFDPSHLKFPDRSFIFLLSLQTFLFRMVPALCGMLTEVIRHNLQCYASSADTVLWKCTTVGSNCKCNVSGKVF